MTTILFKDSTTTKNKNETTPTYATNSKFEFIRKNGANKNSMKIFTHNNVLCSLFNLIIQTPKFFYIL